MTSLDRLLMLEIGTPRSPAFTLFIVGFLEVTITILLSTKPTFTLTPQTWLSQLKTNVKVGLSLPRPAGGGADSAPPLEYSR